MYTVGSTVSDVALTTRSAADALEPDAGVVFTVTLPDGTTATPATTNPSTGVYQALYVTTQAGLHHWSATTTSHGPQTGVFNVEPLVAAAIVSLAEVKDHLNLSVTTYDEELRAAIFAASAWVEERIGPVARRTVVETITPTSGRLFLAQSPVISLTSVIGAYAAGGTWTVGSLYLDGEAGIVDTGYGPPFGRTVTVTYVAGRAIVPGPVQWATKEMVAWLWDTQRGPAQSSPAQADLADFSGPMPTVPRRIEQALEPYARMVVA
jgi:hypothetical protein